MNAYQAIVTKYHGPTNARGSRYSATTQAGRIYVTADDALHYTENHAAAARALAEKWGWSGSWYSGALPDGSFVFVNAGRNGSPDFTIAPR